MFLGLEIGSWADWVSGIGTMLTIGVSFYFARHQESARFNVSPVSGRSVDDPNKPESVVKIENIGYRPINIVYWGTSKHGKIAIKYSSDIVMERTSTIMINENGSKIDIYNVMGVQMPEMGILPIKYKTDVLYDKANKMKHYDNKRMTYMIFSDNSGFFYLTKLFITKLNENNKFSYFVETGNVKKIRVHPLGKKVIEKIRINTLVSKLIKR